MSIKKIILCIFLFFCSPTSTMYVADLHHTDEDYEELNKKKQEALERSEKYLVRASR